MLTTLISQKRSLCIIVFLVLGCAGGWSQNVEITVNTVLPGNTPKKAIVFIAGNNSALGDWNPATKQMRRVNDSLWTYSFQVPPLVTVEFKITRGSWNTQAVYTVGVMPDNCRFQATKDTVIEVLPVSWMDLEKETSGGIVGSVRYHHDISGKGLRYPRDVIVWLPPSYDRGHKRYPVLYMHDGQNIIDPSTSFIGFDWRVDEVSDSLIKAGSVEEIIVVGISNSPDREPEYSDTELGHNYARFVVEELKPLIDTTYRTKPGRSNTAVMGSSMGGLISFLFVWWYPDVFSKAGCLSSAFLVDDDKILKEVESYDGARKAMKVYFDCGTVDLEARLRPGSEKMAKLLLSKGYRKGEDFEYFVDTGAVHNERAWAGRVWRPLVFLFGTN